MINGLKAVAAVAAGVNEIKSNLGDLKKLVQKTANIDQKKEYQVQVTIIEARGLTAKDKDGSDPYVKISIGKLSSQVTSIKQNSSTVVFNQSFTFKDLFLNTLELENQEILIQCIDQNQFALNPLIGQQSIGLSTLYRSNNHEFFKTWLTLIHPDHGIASQGYLLVSCYIIGTEDRPPVHDINEGQEDEDQCSFLNIPDEELTEEQRKRKLILKGPVGPLEMPNTKREQYQLLVSIVKGEDLPILTGSTCDSFVSCRVGGYPLRTPTMKNSQKPNYQTKMVFPVFFPVYNDKIVIRVWDSRTIREDTFIACIPENPNENDWFNINTLHSRGGTMSYRWYHLYGVPINERPNGVVDEVIKKLQKQIEGTFYMGRILLSLSLSPNEKAGLGLQPLGGYKEPPIQKYVVRCDTFELQSSFDCGEFILIEVNFGGKVTRSNLCKKRMNVHSEKSKNSSQKSHMTQLNQYMWKDAYAQIEKEIQIDIPFEKIQQPDFIVSLYSVKPDEKMDFEDSDMKRLAYLRIKATAATLTNEQPNWFQMRPVQYKTVSEIHSHLLLNLELKTELVAKQKTRHQIKRNLKSLYQFKGFFWGAYDLCPSEYSENVAVKAYLQVGARVIEVVSGRKGKNVIWNNHLEFLVELEEKLEFSSNIIVTFYNRAKNGVISDKQEDEEYIGQFAIKADKCEQKQDNIMIADKVEARPVYSYHHITHEGKSNGRVLCSFQIFRSEKTFLNGDEMNGEQYYKIAKDTDFKLVTMQFPLIGVRNLPEGIREPEFVFRVPQPDLKFVQTLADRKKRKDISRDYSYEYIVPMLLTEAQQQEQLEKQERTKTVGGKFVQMISDAQRPALKNFNFCTIIENKVEQALKIPNDLQFVPILEIEVREKNPSLRQTRYHTSINLIEYVPWGDTASKSLRIEFFEVGKFNVSMLDESDQGMEINMDQLNDAEAEQNSRENDFADMNLNELNGGNGNNGNPDPNMIFTDKFHEDVDRPLNSDERSNNNPFSNSLKNDLKDQDDESSHQLLQNSVGKQKRTTQKTQQKINEENKSLMSQQTSGSKKTVSGTSSLSRRLQENQRQFKQGQYFSNAEFNPSQEFSKTEEDDKMFKSERDSLIKELSEVLISFQEAGKKDDGMKKQILRKIEELRNYSIDENLFLEKSDDSCNEDIFTFKFNRNMNNLLQIEQENFNYGREVVKVPFNEVLDKGLPYKKYPLFRYGYAVIRLAWLLFGRVIYLLQELIKIY